MRLTPVATAALVFGSYAAVARAAGVCLTRPARWAANRARGEGLIPAHHMSTLLAEAKRLDLVLTSDDLIYGRDVPGVCGIDGRRRKPELVG